jgi:HK97 gp10 family phage protein
MITVGMNDVDSQIGELVKAYRQLPRNLENKHLKASLGRTLKPYISNLRKNTPPLTTRRGRKKKGEKGPSGALRRSVAVRTKARKGVAYGVLGYRAGAESRKAIWLEFGTSKGIEPREMVKKTLNEIEAKVRAALVKELKVGLERAARDSAPPGTQKFRG